jgi:hypothetical protein
MAGAVMRATLYDELSAEEERQLLQREPNLDTNQQVVFERILPGLYDQNPYADEVNLNQHAGEVARATVPSVAEATRGIIEMRNGPTYCYLAFYGRSGESQYLKIGMTSHPESRLYGMATGNPLDCIAAYVAKFPTRSATYAAEQSLLRLLVSHKRRGEWIEVTADYDAAAGMAGSLGGAIGAEFAVLSYRDGREAA